MLITTYHPGTVLLVKGDSGGPVIVTGTSGDCLAVRRQGDPSAPAFRVSPFAVTRPDAPASPLSALRAELLAAGWSAESPAELDPEAERLAREERWN